MRYLIVVVSLLMAVSVLVVLGLSAESASPKSSSVLFIENVGQFADPVRFQVRGPDATWWLTDDALWADVAGLDGLIRLRYRLPDVETLRWVPHKPHATVVSYLGDDSFPDVPVWHGVRATGVYPGVDLELHTVGARVAARWSDGAIRPIYVDGLPAAETDVDFRAPDLFAPAPASQSVAQLSGSDDLRASTFIGSDGRDVGLSLALGDDDAVYVGGTSNSTVFTPTVGVFAPQHGVDVFVLKLTPDLSSLAYVTWVNPNPDQEDDEDHGLAVGVDGSGHAYLAGWTISPDLCAAVGGPPGYDTSYNGNRDAYLFRLNPTGTQVTACTYFGGTGGEMITDLQVQADGTAFVTGETDSADFPTSDGTAPPDGSRSVLVARFNPGLNSVQTATIVGGSGTDIGRSLAVAADDSVVVTGVTRSADFPTTPGAYDTTPNGGADAFLLRLNGDGETVAYASYLGGARDDDAWSVALDGAGQPVVAGTTFSDDFPVSATAFDASFNHPATGFAAFDGFVARLAADGSALTYGSYLGGGGFDEALAVGSVADGSIMVGGFTNSADFPVSGAPFQGTVAGATDVFLARLQPGETALVYGTLLGGAADEQVNDLAVTAAGEVMLVGETLSADFPTTDGASDTTPNGDYDLFVSWMTAGPGTPDGTPTATPTVTPTVTPTPIATPTPTPTPTPRPEAAVWLPFIVTR